MSLPAPSHTPRPRPSTRAARLADAAARRVIAAGGVVIILSVVGIIAFILAVTLPLFRSAEVEKAAVLPPPARGEAALAAGVDEYRELAYEVLPAGEVEFRDLGGGGRRDPVPMPGAEGSAVSAASISVRGGVVAWGGEDGRAGLVRVRFQTRFLPGGGREIHPRVTGAGSLLLDQGGRRVVQVAGGRAEGGSATLMGILAGGGLVLGTLGDEGGEPSVHDLTSALGSPPTALAVSEDGGLVAVGTESGEVVLWESGSEPRFLERKGVTGKRGVPVASLAFLIGGQSLVAGGADGGLGIWSRVPVGHAGDKALRRIHEFPSSASAVTALAASPRDKGFLSADESGRIRLNYSTSERTLAVMDLGSPARQMVIAPRADGVLALGASGGATLWDVSNPHPEVSWRTLFGKVWYEGLPAPAYVWQSTGGSDEFEPKMSLVPLIFGTVKGAIYALLFSVPIAVGGAVYTSQFAHPRVRTTVKPFVELLAALPSVIIGFLAALWLAPLLARTFPALLLMAVLVPLAVFGAAVGWEALPRGVRGRFPAAGELLLILAAALLAGGIAAALSPWLAKFAFGGDFSHWLESVIGLRYDPRNCVVVGFALGFAVIPIIFTIAEDALSGVPRHLVTASLALGASPWTTAWRVVIPAASAGIFSAVMLGFGRAVGETMIVLMATGNTPVMEWNPFTGMRTLSANIATEVPEAPHGGTLYRILFLSAALLFVFTFLTNTVAEIVGHRLRSRYQRY